MKVDNLEVGMTYKNYPELCKVLECDEKKGKSRTLHIKDFDRYFRYTREGNAYIIDEVYSEPKEKTSNKRNSIFRDITKLLIMDKLAEKGGSLTVSRSHLIEDLGLANSNYNGCKGVQYKLSKYLDMDVQIVYDFYNSSNANYRNIIEGSLNALVDERRIVYHIVTMVKEMGLYTYRKATEDEIQTILNVEGNMLTKLGYKSISDISNTKDWNPFKRKVKDILQAMTGIEYYYSAYDIIIHEERIQKGRVELLELILERSKKNDYRLELNNLVIDNINKNAKRRHEHAHNANKEAVREVRSKMEFPSEINKLSNVLSKLGKEDITGEVYKIANNKNDISVYNNNKLQIDECIEDIVEDGLEGLFD